MKKIVYILLISLSLPLQGKTLSFEQEMAIGSGVSTVVLGVASWIYFHKAAKLQEKAFWGVSSQDLRQAALNRKIAYILLGCTVISGCICAHSSYKSFTQRDEQFSKPKGLSGMAVGENVVKPEEEVDTFREDFLQEFNVERLLAECNNDKGLLRAINEHLEGRSLEEAIALKEAVLGALAEPLTNIKELDETLREKSCEDQILTRQIQDLEYFMMMMNDALGQDRKTLEEELRVQEVGRNLAEHADVDELIAQVVGLDRQKDREHLEMLNDQLGLFQGAWMRACNLNRTLGPYLGNPEDLDREEVVSQIERILGEDSHERAVRMLNRIFRQDD